VATAPNGLGQCCTVTLIVDNGNYASGPDYGRHHDFGHAGVGIEGDFYDFGPGQNGDLLFGSPGGPWWRAGYPLLKSILADPDGISIGNIVYKAEIYVCKEQCERLRDYWNDLYKQKPAYDLLGLNCTTAVSRGLDRAGVCKQRPGGIGVSSLMEYPWVHTCGPSKGNDVQWQRIN
jgi:hypothetical protein